MKRFNGTITLNLTVSLLDTKNDYQRMVKVAKERLKSCFVLKSMGLQEVKEGVQSSEWTVDEDPGKTTAMKGLKEKIEKFAKRGKVVEVLEVYQTSAYFRARVTVDGKSYRWYCYRGSGIWYYS